jgi:hypothetical protein
LRVVVRRVQLRVHRRLVEQRGKVVDQLIHLRDQLREDVGRLWVVVQLVKLHDLRRFVE